MIGVSVINYTNWNGIKYIPLFPNPLVSQHKFVERYKIHLVSLCSKDVRKNIRAAAGEKVPVLLSDKLKQRQLLNTWLECEEL